MEKLSPMMEQYLRIKSENQNCLLFFRLGDFYELFFEDAKTASKELDLTLTGRDCGRSEKAPMCGVPYHSVDSYIAKLVEKGYKIAICEQMEDPKQTKGIVKREVVRIVSSGTVIDTASLDETKNNYICAVYFDDKTAGIAFADVSTGEFLTTELKITNIESKIFDMLGTYKPSEIICNDIFFKSSITKNIEVKYESIESYMDFNFYYDTAKSKLQSHFNVLSLKGYGIESNKPAVSAAGALLQYLYDTQKNNLIHINTIKYLNKQEYMLIDFSSRKNLELTEASNSTSKKNTLFYVLNKTRTSMGARMLRAWIEQPLINISSINERHAAVDELKSNIIMKEDIRETLRGIYDIERLMSKIIYLTANPRDLVSLRSSLEKLPSIKESIYNASSDYLKQIYSEIDLLEDVYQLLQSSIVDEPPFSIREGGFIKKGYKEEIDRLINAKDEGSNWLLDLEEKEKQTTGIKNLKVRYNKIFGYYIEVTKSNMTNVPERYMRKQTLANCERYTTKELTQLEEIILGADEKLVALEYELFCEVRQSVAGQISRIQKTARQVATIDCLQSLAEAAFINNYCYPVMSDNGIINIQNGRHPIVETTLTESFIPNDTFLNLDDDRMAIITGPNMAGKSTYMRQVALIVLMAQIGSFVPADNAEIGIADKIFTRVGASDDLASGQSTFMVEMTEVANILNNATQKSLIILDEIGRGTSTFDGLSIAWAVVEFIADKKLLGARTLFSTHYHELSELEMRGVLGVKNYNSSVAEKDDTIIFLRKIKRGGADGSFGVEVAKLAGVPLKVIKRANQIAKQLDEADITKKTKKIANISKANIEESTKQVDIFTMKETELSDLISNMNLDDMSPREAHQKLFELQKIAKGM